MGQQLTVSDFMGTLSTAPLSTMSVKDETNLITSNYLASKISGRNAIRKERLSSRLPDTVGFDA